MAEDNVTIMAEDNITTGFSNQYTHSDIPIIAIPLFGVISNGLLLLAIFKDPLKCFRNSATYFVINLTVADCLMCIFSLIFYITSIKVELRYAETFRLLVLFCGCASIISMPAIAIDRFLMIVYPIKHRVFVRGKVVIMWIMAIWFASCAVTVTTKFCSWEDGKGVYTFWAFIIAVSTVVYASTYYQLKKQSRNIAVQSSNDTRAQQTRILKEKQFLTTIIIIACISVVCVLPSVMFFETSISLNLNTRKLFAIILTKTFLCIFAINFALNPLIYVLRLPNYRKTFFLLYCKRWYNRS